MDCDSDPRQRTSINHLIEQLTAGLAPDLSSGGQYSPFGPVPSPLPPAGPPGGALYPPGPAGWGPARLDPRPDFHTPPPCHRPHPPPPHQEPPSLPLHRHEPPPPVFYPTSVPPPPPPAAGLRYSPQLGPYQPDLLGPPPDREEFGTARISDNLAAHLAGFDTPLFDPRQPPIPAAPPPPATTASDTHTSFLNSLFGGLFGGGGSSGLPYLPFGGLASKSPDLPPDRQVEPQELGERQQEEVQQTRTPSPPQVPRPPPVLTPEPKEPRPKPAPPLPTAPKPSSSPAPAQLARPSYSSVVSKPPPPPTPLVSQRSEPSLSARASPQLPVRSQGQPESGGGGGRRGGRGHGRRRRSSDTENRPARGAPQTPAGQDSGQTKGPPARDVTVPPDQRTPAGTSGKKATDSGKKKKKGRTQSVESDGKVGSAASVAETLNNNPDRAQPSAPRRPLYYNNNLGTVSGQTLPPQQTPDSKKLDVNVGKQKNYGKTSNENKKVDDTMSKPDNKTLSQSRNTVPLNIMTSASHSKSERQKELAFRVKSGGGRGRRREAEETGGAGGGGGELLRLLRAHLTPGVSLLVTFLAWLVHLVCDVAAMSSRLLWLLLVSVAQYGWAQTVRAVTGVRAGLTARWAAVRHYLSRRGGDSGQRSGAGLQANIPLPSTGEQAMKRLLACKDKDPYSILGVTHDCSDADIKKYYRRQALLVHPDKSRTPGAEEAFKILQRAFELVGFPEQRSMYDAEARERQEADLAFRQYTDELMTRLREKIEETQNTLRCNNCNQRHRRTKTDRPCYAARDCATCKIRHAAREGDIWAESTWFGVFWRYYACMDAAVYDITEWAGCQSKSLKHLQANNHTVQYRIISGAKRHKQHVDEPSSSDRDLEDILNNLYNSSMSEDGSQPGARRRGSKRRAH